MIRTILQLLPAGSRGKVATHLALTLLSVALRAVSAVLLVPIVAALFSAEPTTAWPWVGALVVAVVAGWIVDWAIARIAFGLGFTLLDEGQRNLADEIGRIELQWFNAERTATARQAVAATGPELVGLFVYLATPALGAMLLPVMIAVVLLPVSLPLGLAALAGVPLLFGAYLLSGRLSASADRAADAANGALGERIIEFARTQQALRAARRVEPARSHAGDALAKQHTATMRLLAMQVPGQLMFSLASQLALALLAGTVVWLAVSGSLGAPEAIALIVVIARYLEPFTALAGLAAGMESTLQMLRRIRAVFEAEKNPAGTAVAAPPVDAHTAAPRLDLAGVTFRYETSGAPVLEDLSVSFEPGTTTAIVGPSGSGKSTILWLLAGLHHPTSGSVLINGVDARSLSAEARRELVTVVFQHPYLFDATVRENVLAGDPHADAQALNAAASLARVDSIVERAHQGWETRVGEGGSALSGGERQRVSIARALLKPAPVLLVDEATSALDTENEAAVAAALTDDATPRTRVIVAHRMSSILAADRVLFVDGGKVVEDGPVNDLLAANGRFAEFFERQRSAAHWRLVHRP